MGLNISIYGRDGVTRHPDWDDGRYAGDRELLSMASAMPHETLQLGHPWDCEQLWRPTDFTLFRSHPWHDGNEDRWMRLADILESGDWWIFFSI